MYGIVVHTTLLNINGPVNRNQSHSLKILSAFITTSNTRKSWSTSVGMSSWNIVGQKTCPFWTLCFQKIWGDLEKSSFQKSPVALQSSSPVTGDFEGTNHLGVHQSLSFLFLNSFLFTQQMSFCKTFSQEGKPELSLLIFQILFLGSSHIKVTLFQSSESILNGNNRTMKNTLCLVCSYSL